MQLFSLSLETAFLSPLHPFAVWALQYACYFRPIEIRNYYCHYCYPVLPLNCETILIQSMEKESTLALPVTYSSDFSVLLKWKSGNWSE